MEKLETLIRRLKKIGIEVQFIGNYPWIYLFKINGYLVRERTLDSEHGFNVASLARKGTYDAQFEFKNTKEMFQLIRKYIQYGN